MSLDCETTGLELRHGCKPFLISTCTPEGKVKCWESSVNPVTRQPCFSLQERKEIAKYLYGHVLVFHHAKYDLRALSELGFEIYFWIADETWNDWIVPVSKDFIGETVTITASSYEDTLLASHACSSGDDHGLKSLAIKYLQYSDSDEKELKEAVLAAARYCKSQGIEVTLGRDPTGKRQTAYDYWLPRAVDLDNDVCLRYAGKDAERTILLWRFYEELMNGLGVREQYEKERRLLQVVYKMETGGVTFKKQAAAKKVKELLTKEAEYADEATHWANKIEGKEVNVNSSLQMRHLLYETLEMDVPHTTKKSKQPSTDAKAMEKLLEATSRPKSPDYHPPTARFLKNVMLSRKYGKGAESVTSYQKYGIDHPKYKHYAVLYTSLNQCGTDTSRFSSSTPNGQNVSKVAIVEIAGLELPGPRVREIFCPLPGLIWYSIDYNQLELRVFAHVSQEQSLIDALAAGYDFHGYVATRIFNKPADQITSQQRRIAKNTNFAIIFGASPWKVDLTAGMNGAYDAFAGLFPNVASFMQEMIAKARLDQHVHTLDGYRLDVPHEAPYKIVSYLVQGTAGRIIKNAMLKIDQQQLVDWEHNRLALQIHDELIAEFQQDHSSHSPASVYSLMGAMEEAGRDMGLETPVSCERITTNWGQGEKVTVTPKSIKLKVA